MRLTSSFQRLGRSTLCGQRVGVRFQALVRVDSRSLEPEPKLGGRKMQKVSIRSYLELC